MEAIMQEIYLQSHYLKGETVHTIYFGGGTPSLLQQHEITAILEQIQTFLIVKEDAEITLEANPDDLDKKKLVSLKSAGINRLSIGLQSFNEGALQYLNRAHSAAEAKICVHLARRAGFNNISLDLIYAIPPENHSRWRNSLQEVLALQPEHISSYCLTIEKNTAFGNWLKKGKIKAVSEEFAAQQFEILMETLAANGYEHYEISNFCLPGFYSRHNTNYWKQEKYLGIGPSAHSFNGHTRQFNISNNTKYVAAIAAGTIPFELDILTQQDQINEYIMTSLRTIWGCNLLKLQQEFNHNLLLEHEDYINKLKTENYVEVVGESLVLQRKGKLLADKIASDLFVV